MPNGIAGWYDLPEIPTLKPITTPIRRLNMDNFIPDPSVFGPRVTVRWPDDPDISVCHIDITYSVADAKLYREAYTRFLQARRDFPELSHLTHEPTTDLHPAIARSFREQIERDFYRTV
jgi:hypothetical protein